MKLRHACVGDVRSIGLFAAIELVKDKNTKEMLSPFNKPLSSTMEKVKQYILDNGVFLYTHFNVLLIIPPLIITDEELTKGLGIIDQALNIADSEI